MTNPSMPGLVKVGMSTRVPDKRARDEDLNSTGVPTPFEVQYYSFFHDKAKTEAQAKEEGRHRAEAEDVQPGLNMEAVFSLYKEKAIK